MNTNGSAAGTITLQTSINVARLKCIKLTRLPKCNNFYFDTVSRHGGNLV